MKGDLEYTKQYADIINKCTLCMRCTVNCPSNVRTADLIVAARADKTKQKGISFPFNIVYKWILPRRILFGNIVRIASWLQRIFMRRKEGGIRHLPFFLSGLMKGRYIPTISAKFLRQMIPETNLHKNNTDKPIRVGYFTGCMTDFVFPETGKNIIKLLNDNGVDVIVPKAQGCCGAPVFLGAGDFETGRIMADSNVQAFKDVDIVIADCATCSSSLKEYAKLLADTPERLEKYTAFTNKIVDITEFLVDTLKLPSEAYKINNKFKGKDQAFPANSV